MNPSRLDRKVVTERSEWVHEMLRRIRSLPLDRFEDFTSETRNVDAAESCLRRALEAILDLGRHVLAKGFGDAPAEYRDVARRLEVHGVLAEDEAALLAKMAGYRNRLVHFYDRVAEDELYEICTERLTEVEDLLAGIHRWIREHPEKVDEAL